jgi:excisionase family DNA binding protein
MDGPFLETTPACKNEQGPAALLTVESVAEMLACSTRHVRRLADGGRMPAPVRLGALIRWRRADIEEWIAAGCPPCRKPGRSR